MARINCRSDFDFKLELTDARGVAIGWPEFDWTARFWTHHLSEVYVASCRQGVATNCFNDGGVIHVVADNHGLSAGPLHVEFRAEIPSALYPDGFRREVTRQTLDIELTRESGEQDVELTAELNLMGYKGDKGEAFRWEDFTEAQLDALAARVQLVALSAGEISDLFNVNI